MLQNATVVMQLKRTVTCWNFVVIRYFTCKQGCILKYFNFNYKSSQRPQSSANAMFFARWQHHIRFGSGFSYAPLKAMLTKI